MEISLRRHVGVGVQPDVRQRVTARDQELPVRDAPFEHRQGVVALASLILDERLSDRQTVGSSEGGNSVALGVQASFGRAERAEQVEAGPVGEPVV